MSFHKSMVIDNQINTGVVPAKHSFLIQTSGCNDVALSVTGVSEFGETDILTVMSGEQCLRFMHLLLDICKLANGGVAL